MMNPNSMNGAEDQQVKQLQQIRSNQDQMDIPGQKVAEVAGMKKVQDLSAAQRAQEQANLGKTLATYALTDDGKTSVLGNLFSNPENVSEIAKSVAQQSRLKGLA